MIDGVGQLDAFIASVSTNHEQYVSQLRTILTYMNYLAAGNSLSVNKFRDITPEGETIREYEFKSKHLRVYAIKKQNGKIVVLGGFKNTQKQDFKRFRSLKEHYLNSLL